MWALVFFYCLRFAPMAVTPIPTGFDLALSPQELVRRCVENEFKMSDQKPKSMFRFRKETAGGSQTKLMVETQQVMVGLTLAVNDRPLNAAESEAEISRVERLVKDPKELAKKIKQEKEDAQRITRIMAAMPEAFLYEDSVLEPGAPHDVKPSSEMVRLNFHPNPKYNPPSRVEQVLTGMRGYVIIDADKLRLVKIDGTLGRDVGFGWGILGHLDKGGHFAVEQGEAADGQYQIMRMDLSFTGKILIFKGIAVKTVETYSDYHTVPSSLSCAQGLALLHQKASLIEKR